MKISSGSLKTRIKQAYRVLKGDMLAVEYDSKNSVVTIPYIAEVQKEHVMSTISTTTLNKNDKELFEYNDTIPLKRLWDLRTFLADVIIKHLTAFRKVCGGHPLPCSCGENDGYAVNNEKEWKLAIEDMIYYFKCIHGDYQADKISEERFCRGAQMFKLYFGDLWF